MPGHAKSPSRRAAAPPRDGEGRFVNWTYVPNDINAASYSSPGIADPCLNSGPLACCGVVVVVQHPGGQSEQAQPDTAKHTPSHGRQVREPGTGQRRHHRG